MNKDRFKFRVWWKSPYTNVSSKYLYYDPHENNYRTDIIRDADCYFAEDIIYYDLRDIILGNIDEYERPATFTVEQCTGLKDENGNLIYEGDVLLCDRKDVEGATGAEIHYKSSGVVQRDKNGKYFIEGKDWYGSDITFYNECAEIVGNIHEQKDSK